MEEEVRCNDDHGPLEDLLSSKDLKEGSLLGFALDTRPDVIKLFRYFLVREFAAAETRQGFQGVVVSAL